MNILICALFLFIFTECLLVHQSKGYVLLSQGKNAKQSSTYLIDTPAEKAVDGNLRQNWPNLAVTNLEPSVDWYVDLGATRNINNVKIYYRNKAGQEDFFRTRFSGFSLYISDDANFKSGHNCGVNSTYPPLIYNISCPYTGRYVRLYDSRSDGTAILELAEVQVFGCLSSMKYGANCQDTCSSICESGRCNIIDGNCFSCVTGYVLVNGACVCGNNTYGPDCTFECGKCKDGRPCNTSNGECTNGCAPEFYPPMCNMSILSEGKDTFMSTVFQPDTTKDKAVDGDLSQKFPNMAMTAFANTVYWYVDLGTPTNIHNIKIYYRDETKNDVDAFRKRFAGFSLYISDDGNSGTGHKCSVNSTYPPLIYNIFCQYGGRYVKVYNYRSNGKAILELGEVQVFGCLSFKMYGVNCESSCSSKCKDRRCNVVNGKCFSCVAGYKGDRCDIECEKNEYGAGCLKICGSCRNSLPCEKGHGICTTGCDRGFQLPYCTEICKHGTYGFDCNLTCIGNCKGNDSCNILTGLCDRGCADGWTGNRCEKECIPGRYGEGCLKYCSRNCKHGTLCHHVTGACKDGCIDGFHSNNCSLSCSVNCFGNAVCNSSSGTCEEGCSAGWKGERCDVECDTYKYGLECAQKCGKCRNGVSCDKITGQCIPGCSPGYLTQFCNESCTPGDFGEDCLLKCSGNCLNKITCNVGNGYCDDGCENGWRGDRCDEEDKSNTQLIIGVSSGAGILVLLIILGAIALLLLRRLRPFDSLSYNADKKVSTKDGYKATEHQANTGQNTIENTPAYINLNINSEQNTAKDSIDNTEYQELAEVRDNNPYDVISD